MRWHEVWWHEIVRFSLVTFLGETFLNSEQPLWQSQVFLPGKIYSTWPGSEPTAPCALGEFSTTARCDHQRLFMDFYLLSFLPNTEWSGPRAVLIWICLAWLPTLLVWEINHHWPYYCSDLKSLVKIYKLNILLTSRYT